MFNPTVSFFNNGIRNTTKQHHVTIEKLFSGIVTCEKWRIQIEQVRKVLQACGKGQVYKEAKKDLPYFIPGGIWSDRTAAGVLLKDSNLIQIDIDNIFDTGELARIRQVLINDAHTLLQFMSPSAAGFKAFFVLPDGYTQHHRLSVRGYFSDNYNIEVDPVVLKNNKTACYVSYDERATYNPNCKIFDKILIQEPEKVVEPFKVDPVNIGGSLPDYAAAFCEKVIAAEAELIATAPEGQGSRQLNLSAYSVGRYSELQQDHAAPAFKAAFMSRSYSKHDAGEFTRIFNAGFAAGRKKQRSIPDRPYTRQH